MSPTRRDERAGCPGPTAWRAGRGLAKRAALPARPVTEAEDLGALMEGSLPSFGSAYLRRVWKLLDEAVGRGVPLTLAISGPVTLSGQTYTWLGPLLDTGWFCLLSTTDAVCYHDGHRALRGAKHHPIHEVAIFGDDGGLRDERTIRVTDIGFSEDVLLEQDRYLRALLKRPEFQRRMAGPEFRHLLGRAYADMERASGAAEGLMALCARKAIPVFVGAPADGSVFLNSMALWALEQATGEPRDAHRFDLDLHAEVLESCAYHLWGLRESEAKALGTLILGGGVPKNFNLQPEPALSQVLGLPRISGYLYDIQITTAPVTDGSLSSCPPAEAVTWGKVDKASYRRTTESLQCDYSIVMPFLAKALLEKRARFAGWAERMGREALFAKHPVARGYLRPAAGYRLYERRAELSQKLLAEVKKRAAALRQACDYELAPRGSPAGPEAHVAPGARVPRAAAVAPGGGTRRRPAAGRARSR